MKHVALMQDLSCLGKCSMTVILPVISAMGVSCSVLPTAALSTHTAFPGPAVTDLTGFARKTMSHWAGLGAKFDGLLTGYLANPGQATLAKEFLSRFAGDNTRIIVDPAMGDHGKLYAGLGLEMIPAMKELCRMADLCIPNITEGAMLAGIPWQDRRDADYCREIARGLTDQGCRAVLITGASAQPGMTGCFYSDGETEFCTAAPELPRSCHGTGDLFAGVMMGALMRGLEPRQAAYLAGEFVRRSIASTGPDSRWGVAFEEHLGWLAAAVDNPAPGE